MPIWVVLVLAAFILLAPWAAVRYAHAGAPRSAVQTEVTVEKIKLLSRAELLAMLNRVKTSPTPDPRIGALCYETITIYDRAEYICSHCGEKTIYPKGIVADQLVNLQDLLREFHVFQKTSPLKMEVEENGYCKHCPSGGLPRGATVIVTYEDGSSHRFFSFSMTDLRLLQALFAGKLLWDAGNDNEFDLKEQIPRLQDLLGVRLGDIQ